MPIRFFEVLYGQMKENRFHRQNAFSKSKRHFEYPLDGSVETGVTNGTYDLLVDMGSTKRLSAESANRPAEAGADRRRSSWTGAGLAPRADNRAD